MDINCKNGFELDLLFNTTPVKQLKQVFDVIPSSVVIVNADGHFLYVNKRGLELYGCEYSGFDMTAHISKVNAIKLNGEPFPLEDMPVSHSLKSGQAVRNVEMIIENANGIKYPVNVSSAPIYNIHGKINGAIVIFEDFIKRKQVEDALVDINEQLLQSVEEKYHLLFNMIDQGFFIIDIILDENDKPVDMYYVEANNAATKMLGMDFSGKRLRDIDPNYEEYWFKIFGNVALTGQSIRMEQYADPDKKWYSFYIFKIGGEKSRRIGNIFMDITAQKQAQEVLKESEQLFRTLFENSVDGFVLVKPIFDESGHSDNYIVMNVNQAFEKQTGFKADDFIGKTIRESLPGVESVWPLAFANVLKSGESVHFESFNHNSNRWYDLYAFNYQKGLVGVLFRDISNRKKIEEALRESEERLRALAVASTNVVYRMNTDWNSMTELYDTGELNANLIYKCIHPDDLMVLTGVINECIRDKKLFEMEYRVLKADGSVRWIFSKAVPLLDGNGKIKEWFGTANDITERKRAEEVKREYEERQEFLFKLSDALKPLVNLLNIMEISVRSLGEHLAANRVYYSETMGDVVIIRQTYCKGLQPMTGHYRLIDFEERLVVNYRAGKTSVCNNVNTDSMVTKEEAMMITGSVCSAYITVPVVKNGEWVATLAVHNIEPRVWTATEVGLVEEVAERIRASVERAKTEEERERLLKELEQADKNKNEFINALSHELRNPLASITAGLHILEITQNPKQTEKVKHIMNRQISQLCHLVDDLLDLTRISHNKIDLRKEVIDLNNLTLSVAEDNRPLYEAKQVKLITDIKGSSINVNVDAIRIKQIIGNLLMNALKFTNADGEAVMSVYTENYESVICVKDTGIGIDPAMLENLFNPFTQVDTSLDRRNGGLGLGLSIARGIAELHGGSVSAFSEGLGKGSTFEIRLPLTDINNK